MVAASVRGVCTQALVKEMPSLKKLSKEMEAAEAAIEKQLAQIRKEAERQVSHSRASRAPRNHGRAE